MTRLRTAVRRAAMIPATAAVAATALALLPAAAAVNLLVAGARLLLPGRHRTRWRIVRLGTYLVIYTCVDLAGTVLAAGLWVRGAGDRRRNEDADRERYYRVLQCLLAVLLRVGCPLFGVRLHVESPDGGTPVLPPRDVPLLILSRHAGPGDSFLLVQAMLTNARLRPMIVMKDRLRLDPAFDLLLGRLPVFFVREGADGAEKERGIATLASAARPGDALVLFPEGGNFTEERRRRALRWLRRTGQGRLARQAERMPHVLPPHTAGTLAALRAAPTADVVFVAHTGLDAVLSLGDLWRKTPLTRPVVATWWHVRAEDIPPTDEERRAWLFAHWSDVDTWIGMRQAEGRPSGSAAASGAAEVVEAPPRGADQQVEPTGPA